MLSRYRMMPIELYEMEPESGEDEPIDFDLDFGLDQLEDVNYLNL